MSLLIVTITDRVGYVSQDTFVTDRGDAPSPEATKRATEDIQAAIESTFIGDGTPPADKVLCHRNKLSAFLRFGLAVAGCGSLGFQSLWLGRLSHLQGDHDVVGIDAFAPGLLRGLRAELLEASLPSIGDHVVCHIGWSRTESRVRGFIYNAADDFKAVPLGAGHTMMPAANPEDPDYDALYEAWSPAVRGEGVEGFHILAAANMHRSYRAGRLAPGAGIGGDLWTAQVDSGGVTLAHAHRFPES